jgi:hypothetical protein
MFEIKTTFPKSYLKIFGYLKIFAKSKTNFAKTSREHLTTSVTVFVYLLNPNSFPLYDVNWSCVSVPQVLRICSQFLEERGVIDGIYRAPGISSNIQRIK